MAYVSFKVDGKKVPSVSAIKTIVGDKGGLFWWNNQIGLGTHPDCEFQTPCPKCMRRPGLTTQEAMRKPADVGKYAHALIELQVKGVGGGLEEYGHLSEGQMLQAGNCLEQFDRWYKAYDVSITDTELNLVSRKHMFGGRVDAIGRVMGKFALIDWKTSKGIYADYLNQMAGYVILVEECLDTVVEEIHLIRISKDVAAFEHRSILRESFEPAIEYFLQARLLHALTKPMEAILK